ncbi:hypothetical protein, partial [Cupriavidus pauculus]|uniref:hypothetical protein n=1 Tax=Cupriavidus pauculus TaxID=82633 RepID=UPI001F2D547D
MAVALNASGPELGKDFLKTFRRNYRQKKCPLPFGNGHMVSEWRRTLLQSERNDIDDAVCVVYQVG